jgi:hypothetical protein
MHHRGALLSLLAVAACSEAAPRPSTSAGSLQCEPQRLDEPEQPQGFAAFHATIVDQDAAPTWVESAQVCGFDTCLVSDVAENGDVAFEDELPIVGPAFKLGLGLGFAKFAFPLSEATTDLGTTVAVRLPAFDENAELAADATSAVVATSNGVTLTLAAGSALDIDALTYRSTERGFRAVILPAEPRPHAVGTELADAVVVALSPSETTICPSARLSVPNTEGWPAGTRLEFLLHGTSIEQKFAPYGGWQVVSTGSVSADGSSLDTAGGEGLPALSAVAIRPAP